MIARLALLALFAVSAYAQGDFPPFLQNADARTRASFAAVIKANSNNPEPQVDAAVDAWAAAQAPAVKIAYNKFKAEIEKYRKADAAAHDAAVAAFSPAARAADAQLNKISSQPGLSFEAKQQQINKFIGSLDGGVRAEILKASGGQNSMMRL